MCVGGYVCCGEGWHIKQWHTNSRGVAQYKQGFGMLSSQVSQPMMVSSFPTRRLPLLQLLGLLLQVRFISHVLDKNSAVLGKLPEFASLTRDLRAFVAANSRTWEPRDSSTAPAGAHAAAAGGAAAPAATASNAADTTASGMRDVAGKA